MRILRLTPDRTGGAVVARFDIELTDECRLYGLTLRQSRKGHRIDVPNLRGAHVVTFAAPLARQITDAALAAMNGRPDAYDVIRAA